MKVHHIETDYLVIGCGAAGMAFTDALVAACDADVVIVDRRHAPGGHWHDAYPFVRLHQPSAYYGVNSLPLGSDTIDTHGPNEGLYEQASAPEICAYFDRVMQKHLLPSGRVRYFPMCDSVGDDRFVSRVSGAEHQVRVRRKVVDARYLEPSVPSSSAAPFDRDQDASLVTVNALARLPDSAAGYVIVGAGKTAIDACLWLLQSGVTPDAIRWIKPSESWLVNRVFAQGGELVGSLIEGVSLQMEAAARARSLEDLFTRLNTVGALLRIDETVMPTAFRGATVTARELEQLRRIEQVVRLGRVKRLRRDSIELDRGVIPTTPQHVHVHCAASGLNPAPTVPIFSAGRITLQPIRVGLIPFNAALVGYVEATRRDIDEQNRLCPPNRLPRTAIDWVRGMLVQTNADHLWSKETDMAAWLERARLNPSRGVRQRADDPAVRTAMSRFAANVRAGVANLSRFSSEVPAQAAARP